VIAELRDLPKLLYLKLRDIRTVGDFILLEQFGWENLLRDIRNMYSTYMDVVDKVDFLLKNQGKPVRRRFTFPLETSSEVMDSTLGVNGLMHNSAPAFNVPSRYEEAGYHRLTKKLEECYTFSGSYIFYLNSNGVPVNDTPEERERLSRLLQGLTITPAIVWDALPWSWLVDYFINIGDILSNMYSEIADRQLTTHAYIQCAREVSYLREGSDGILHASCMRKLTMKIRRKVDPYGLALNTELSERQLMILAALGLSRS
jgi:hypothetical protein